MNLPNALCALVAVLAIVVLALAARRSELGGDHLVIGCDTFGYERMARVLRQARTTGAPADYFLHDDQTRWLIGKFKESGLPVSAWAEVVTAHAHHYFPGSDQVGPQYPPGTGWTLSLFPAGDDVRALDRLTILCVAAIGLGLVAWCAWRGLTASSLAVAGAVATALAPLQWIRQYSYSINATILPMFAGTVLAWMAANTRRRHLGVLLGFGAGLLFGLLVQIRLASVLLAPAAALLFVPRAWRRLPAFAAGVVLTGIVPVLLHNRAVTGQAFSATYNSDDRLQTLDCVVTNARFYFETKFWQSGVPCTLGLLAAVVGWFVLASAARPRGAVPAWRRWLTENYGLVAAPFCAVGVSVAYFLTHVVTISYYLTPAMQLTGLLLAALFVAMETRWQATTGDFVASGTLRAGVAIAAVLAAGVATGLGSHALRHIVRSFVDGYNPPTLTLSVPAELLAPRALIWTDDLSSSIIYYTGHPAFKISFSDAAMRRRLYGWVAGGGYSQYLVADSDVVKPFVAEARADGWRLTPVGTIYESVCYRMEAP